MTELELLRKSHKVMLEALMSAERFLMGKARKDPDERDLVFVLSAAISIVEDNMALMRPGAGAARKAPNQ